MICKNFNVTLKYKGEFFMAKTVIVLEKTIHDNPMVFSACPQTLHSNEGRVIFIILAS